MQTIRVFFVKRDIAKYLSHLDLMRCFTRSVKRTGFPVWYTEGFNPHLYLMFPAPLSLGFESEYEVVDMRMEEEQDLGLFVEKLNEALPSGIHVLRAEPAVMSYKEVAYSRWEILLRSGDIRQAVMGYLDQERIMVRRKNKKGVEREEDIKPLIRSVSVDYADECLRMTCELASSPAIGLNPSLFLEGLQICIPEQQFEVVRILRTALLNERGKIFC